MSGTTYQIIGAAKRQPAILAFPLGTLCVWAAIACSLGLISGCTSANGARVASAIPVNGATTATPDSSPASTPTADDNFQKALARINAFNANIAKDNGSAAQSALFIDIDSTALAGAVAVSSQGLNPSADVATFSSAVKAINDIAQLPSVQATKSAQVKQAVAAAAGTGNNANALASRIALIFEAATAKGATPKSALLNISRGLTEAQAQAATAAVAPSTVTP